MSDSSGAPPRQGDGDEGRALVVDDPERDPWKTLLDTGAALIGPHDWWPPTSTSVQASLLSAIGRRRDVARADDRPRQFPDAGMVILRSRPEDGPEIWCRCDGGPLGFLSIAAHGHADALSLEVRHDGVEILADPGTYCYHGESEWREWFRSTAAHNTVELGGVSQADSGGPFLWTTDVQTTTVTCDVGEQPVQSWAAEHEGYLRLAPSARHRRSVTLDSGAHQLTVVDTICSSAPTPLQISWHLGPDVDVVLEAGRARISWQSGSHQRCGTITLPAQLSWTLHRGQVEPVAGWYSPRFGSRIPTSALLGRGVANLSTQCVTKMELM
jgi:Heparinase II/III-like protein